MRRAARPWAGPSAGRRRVSDSSVHVGFYALHFSFTKVYLFRPIAANIRGSSLSAVDSDVSNEYWLTSSSFLQVTFVACRLLSDYCW